MMHANDAQICYDTPHVRLTVARGWFISVKSGVKGNTEDCFVLHDIK